MLVPYSTSIDAVQKMLNALGRIQEFHDRGLPLGTQIRCPLGHSFSLRNSC